MRKKSKRKERKVEEKVAQTTIPTETGPPGILTNAPDGSLTLRPFPDDLLDEAEQEPDHIDLAEYWRVIAKLREKGLTFREVADWLSQRGVDADHNAVYRVYSKHLTPDQIMVEADREEREKNLLMEL